MFSKTFPLCLLLSLLALTCSEPTQTKCEPIRVDLCRRLGYNVTGMGTDLQNEADLTLQTYLPLIQYGCSSQLHLFLCSVYVPMCTEKVANPIGPCRNLCETVRSRCYPVLQGFGFPWPAALNCSKFPKENNHEHMCMEGPGEVGAAPSITNLVQATSFSAHCPRLHVYVNHTGRCAPLCDADVFWDTADKSLAEVWLETWSILCFVSSIVALLSFLVDDNRLRFPERPLAVLAFCYMLCSVGWGVRALAGRRAVGCHPNHGHFLLVQDGLRNPNCAIVFLLLYYFGMAASVWWVVVCACWSLATWRRWTHEKLSAHSSLLHLAGWGLPAAQTVAALVRQDVDADELTGICYVGNQDTDSLTMLVLVPQSVYLVTGVLFLLVGVMSRRKEPNSASHLNSPAAVRLTTGPLMQSRGIATIQMPPPVRLNGLTKLGVFCGLYAVPLACVVVSGVYELIMRRTWERSTSPTTSVGPPPRTVPVQPLLWLALLKIFMSLVVGVTAIAWVWSPKTLRAWQRVVRRLGPAAYKQPPVKCAPVVHAPTVHYCPAPMLSAPGRQHKTHAPYRKQRAHHKHCGSETIL